MQNFTQSPSRRLMVTMEYHRDHATQLTVGSRLLRGRGTVFFCADAEEVIVAADQ
jgi:hypothetical protein